MHTATAGCLVLLSLSQAAPGVAQHESFPVGEVVPEVVTLTDADQKYALYLPSDYDPDMLWPVLLVLDPRGRALVAMDLFKEAAERNGFIVLSSYNTRSDTLASVTTTATQALLREIPRRFAFDPRRLVLAGMSGTAHAGWKFGQALQGRLFGVIATAGGVQKESYGEPESEVPFAYFGIIGKDDFNYQEMMDLERHLGEVGSPHRFEVFDGRHGWPPKELTERAVDWMALQFSLQGITAVNSEFVSAQLASRRQQLAKLDDPLDRLRQLRALKRDFVEHGLTDQEEEELSALEASSKVKVAGKEERRLAARERVYLTSSLGVWIRLLRQQDTPPSVAQSLVQLQVARLRKQAEDTDSRRAASARRLLETVFTQSSFYLPNSLFQQGEKSRAETALRVAGEVFPERPFPHWRLAMLHADSGHGKPAARALKEALRLGISVSAQQLTEDPRWDPVRERPEEWQEVVALAKAATSSSG